MTKINVKSKASHDISLYSFLSLLSFSLLSVGILSSPSASADTSATLNVQLTVPSACTLTIANATLTDTIGLGQSSTLGPSNLKAVCNDSEGMAIYAVGFTGDNYGTTTLVSDAGTIATGIASPATASQWNMVVANNTSVSNNYAATIPDGTNGAENFTQPHVIPSTYTKIASYASATDQAIGMNINTSINAYISYAQPAGLYEGKVKYTLVQPADANIPVSDEQIAVIYDGNGLTFAGGATTNRVVYERTCNDIYGYIGSDYSEVMSSNITTGGTWNYPYPVDDYASDVITKSGTDMLKVDVTYGLNSSNSHIDIYEGTYEWGDWDTPDGFRALIEGRAAGSKSFAINNDTATIMFADMDNGGVADDEPYNYGMYTRVYPVYNEPTEGATYGLVTSVCSIEPVTSNYAETSPWNNYWTTNANGTGDKMSTEIPDPEEFYGGVTDYLFEDYDSIAGSTITLYSHFPYTIHYYGNGSTAGSMQNDIVFDEYGGGEDHLIAPNYSRTNYGFAGWSESQNAVLGGSDKIYGPSETINVDELTYGYNTHLANLYAVWVPKESNVTMQSFDDTAEPYASYPQNKVIALEDERDNDVYAVAKLADGKWWMIENLRLDSGATITTSNTHSNGSFGGAFAGLATSEPLSSFGYTNTADNSLYNTTNITGNNRAYRIPRYNNDNTASRSNSPQSGSDNLYAYGNRYNWPAATANTSDITSSTSWTSSSICPSGWHLPSGQGLVNDIGNLVNEVGDFSAFDNYPINLVLSVSYNGSYWTSSSRNASNAYYYNLHYGTLNAASYNYRMKSEWAAVRCVKD